MGSLNDKILLTVKLFLKDKQKFILEINRLTNSWIFERTILLTLRDMNGMDADITCTSILKYSIIYILYIYIYIPV